MNLPRDLGGGLMLRRAGTDQDIERIIELAEKVLMDNPDADIASLIRIMVGGDHPTMTRSDFYLVEDTAKDLLVSSMCLIPQVWTYDGIPFGVGRPELVATLPGYRRRGLVRAQFEALHADCAARDLPVQAVTGIPFFYRLFDYEYALSLGAGFDLYVDAVPTLAEGEAEPYTIRRVTETDLPAMMEMAADFFHGRMITCRRDARIWRYFLHKGRHSGSETFYVLVAADDGSTVGYFGVANDPWSDSFEVAELVLHVGTPYTGVMPSLLRAVRRLLETEYARPDKLLPRLRFSLGDAHPAYAWLKTCGASEREPYAWYLRVADLPGFIRRIKPALEARLAASPMAGYGGDLKLRFYRVPGVRLVFDAGRLVKVRSTDPADEEAQAAFPPLVFLKLLFGYRTFDELKYVFPDVWAHRDAKLVLEALFPKRPSWVQAIQ